MIEIRNLTEKDMIEALSLKILCWTEELAGRAENTLTLQKELDFWLKWMHTAKEHEDIRLLIGAFENGKMLGVAFSSLADQTDIKDKGIELNGLWVYPHARNRGISLMLIHHVLEFFVQNGMEKMVIYNPHYAPSNSFYRKFGAEVTSQVKQMDGQLLVDVFIADIMTMKIRLEESLKKYL